MTQEEVERQLAVLAEIVRIHSEQIGLLNSGASKILEVIRLTSGLQR